MTDKTADTVSDNPSSESQNRTHEYVNMEMMNSHHPFNSAQPIPELFTDTTVLFADIEGYVELPSSCVDSRKRATPFNS